MYVHMLINDTRLEITKQVVVTFLRVVVYTQRTKNTVLEISLLRNLSKIIGKFTLNDFLKYWKEKLFHFWWWLASIVLLLPNISQVITGIVSVMVEEIFLLFFWESINPLNICQRKCEMLVFFMIFLLSDIS